MGICLFEKIYARHFSFSKAGEIFQTVFITTPNPQNRSLGATSPPRDAMAVVLTCSRSLSGLDPPGLASPRQGHLLVASKRYNAGGGLHAVGWIPRLVRCFRRYCIGRFAIPPRWQDPLTLNLTRERVQCLEPMIQF